MSKQTDMFTTSNADLPLLSGTAPRATESIFAPKPAARQIPFPLASPITSTLVSAAQTAVDRIADYLGSGECFRDPHELKEALDALEDALKTYYDSLRELAAP